MAKEAERLLDGSASLPAPLCFAKSEPTREAEALPDFLTGGENAAADPEEAEPNAIAAE